jgi:hypothetical protein
VVSVRLLTITCKIAQHSQPGNRLATGRIVSNPEITFLLLACCFARTVVETCKRSTRHYRLDGPTADQLIPQLQSIIHIALVWDKHV